MISEEVMESVIAHTLAYKRVGNSVFMDGSHDPSAHERYEARHIANTIYGRVEYETGEREGKMTNDNE